MRLPWYVALDRWVRRNPSTAQTIKGCGALSVVLLAVMSLSDQSPWHGLGLVAVALFAYFGIVYLGRQLLEDFADEWREEH